MKITLEPTEAVDTFPTVSIAIAGDHQTIEVVWFDLVRPALMAWGFTEQTLDDLISEDKDVS